MIAELSVFDAGARVFVVIVIGSIGLVHAQPFKAQIRQRRTQVVQVQFDIDAAGTGRRRFDAQREAIICTFRLKALDQAFVEC